MTEDMFIEYLNNNLLYVSMISVILMFFLFAINPLGHSKKITWNEGNERLYRRKKLNNCGYGNANLANISDVLEHRGPTEFYIKTYRPLRVIRADKCKF